MIRTLDWNPDTKSYEDHGRIFVLARPDQVGNRGGRICAVCGGPTQTVLDGEGWCQQCGRYQ